MNDPVSDPAVPIRALAAALGLPAHRIWWLQRNGFATRPSKGMAGLVSALRGQLAALRVEAADAAPYRAPLEVSGAASPGDLCVDQVERQIRRLSDTAEDALCALIRDRRKPLKGQRADGAAATRRAAEHAIRRIRATAFKTMAGLGRQEPVKK